MERKERGKEGRREGGRKEKMVEALDYRGTEFIVLENKGVHLPLVVDAPLLDKCFVKNFI